MATRSPTQTHSYWGTYANPAALAALVGDLRLQEGDTAYSDSDKALYAFDGAAWQRVGDVAIASERWVTTGGSDLTGNGSLSAPYATVGAALASITTASPTNRWAVRVAAGTFTEAAPLLLKPNVFVVGEDRNATRITAPSVSLAASFTGAGDNRAGFANLTLTGACDFNFQTVTSNEGKVYANGVNFNSAASFTGYSAINQTVFFDCYFFGAFSTSGVNHGAHVSCVHGSSVTLNQHPSLPSILNAIGGSAGATTLTTAVTDFARRCSVFAKNFWMGSATVDGASSYLDATASSLPVAGATLLNSGNLVWIDQAANRKLSNLQGPTAINESLVPDLDSSRYLGDFGKQWLFSFSYLVASTGTDLYVITTPSSFGPSPGHAIYIQPDAYGLALNANGGNVEVETVPATGTGNSGSLVLKTGAVATGVRGDLTIDVNETNLVLAGALNVNTAPGASGEVLTSNGPGVAPTWQAGGGSSSAITLSLDGTSAATVATYVGAVYVPAVGITLGASSQAFLGTAGAGETVTLDLLSGATVVATFSASITGFQAVLVTGTPVLAAGWYDLVLTAGATAQAFARGLYLTV